MYKHEIQSDIEAGKKVRRGSWPKGHYLVKVPGGPAELTEEEEKITGLSKGADVTINDTLVYCESKTRGQFGYQMTSGDLASQDWELA